jgi:thioredoxin
VTNEIGAVTDEDFAAIVLKSNTPVLVEFWAEWCDPCRRARPILDEIADEHGDEVRFLRMDVDENPVTPSAYGLTAIPTISVYVDGEAVRTVVGVKPKAELLAELADFFA